ncbi:hypothetical protein RI054_15g73850 [Pseudoscourfieldia marina]
MADAPVSVEEEPHDEQPDGSNNAALAASSLSAPPPLDVTNEPPPPPPPVDAAADHPPPPPLGSEEVTPRNHTHTTGNGGVSPSASSAPSPRNNAATHGRSPSRTALPRGTTPPPNFNNIKAIAEGAVTNKALKHLNEKSSPSPSSGFFPPLGGASSSASTSPTNASKQQQINLTPTTFAPLGVGEKNTVAALEKRLEVLQKQLSTVLSQAKHEQLRTEQFDAALVVAHARNINPDIIEKQSKHIKDLKARLDEATHQADSEDARTQIYEHMAVRVRGEIDILLSALEMRRKQRDHSVSLTRDTEAMEMHLNLATKSERKRAENFFMEVRSERELHNKELNRRREQLADIRDAIKLARDERERKLNPVDETGEVEARHKREQERLRSKVAARMQRDAQNTATGKLEDEVTKLMVLTGAQTSAELVHRFQTRHERIADARARVLEAQASASEREAAERTWRDDLQSIEARGFVGGESSRRALEEKEKECGEVEAQVALNHESLSERKTMVASAVSGIAGFVDRITGMLKRTSEEGSASDGYAALAADVEAARELARKGNLSDSELVAKAANALNSCVTRVHMLAQKVSDKKASRGGGRRASQDISDGYAVVSRDRVAELMGYNDGSIRDSEDGLQDFENTPYRLIAGIDSIPVSRAGGLRTPHESSGPPSPTNEDDDFLLSRSHVKKLAEEKMARAEKDRKRYRSLQSKARNISP